MQILRNIWFIARSDLFFALRDRATLLWLVLMPPVFFFFIGNMTAGGLGNFITQSEIAFERPAESDPVGQRFGQILADTGFRIVDPAEKVPQLRLSGQLTGAEQPPTARFDIGAPGPTDELYALRLNLAAAMLRAELAVLAARDVPSETLAELAKAPRTLTVEVEPGGRLGRVPTGFEQTVPGILVMFTMLVLLTSGGVLLVMERDQGLLLRLASAPLSREEIIAGKWLGRMMLALCQVGMAMVFGTILFGMDWGPNLPAILLVLAVWAAVCASLGLLLGSLGRSQAEVTGLGLLVTMAMAALGGAWWPIEVTPAFMQDLQKAIPAGWTMDAMHRLVSFGDPAWAVLPHVAALALTAVLAGWASARVFRFH
ncbi:ABC transporter permease [Aliiruegeria sabulilitoris]|uniref:ABC transporter permease n=1 Tax=Aliiruegeria sabulilitoris TaxID=1510458 RepID=UPI000832B02B|nr:ABC transporter permease [Aliiruegeria sabulilitoris]NDR58671.1 ABC transporter permease subunit [Pseudoruegeria sp. M32A2M]